MVNDAYLAKMARDELGETLFFAGIERKLERTVIRGKKAYVYTTPLFTLTIQGRNINIDGEKFRSVSACKRFIQDVFVAD